MALCTGNFSEPALGPNSTEQSDDNVIATIWAGNQSTQNITGLNFQPDMIFAKRRGGVQEGGITTQEGLVNVHPQEAIVPIEQLGGMINTAMTPVKDEISMLRRDMQSYFGFGGSAGKDIGKSVASNLVG